jgi:Domain of unknown function (DUF4253)
MASSTIPDDGQLRLGPLTLPAGRRITAGFGSGQPVAWATEQPVPGAGRAWQALSGAHAQTGLVPFLLKGLDRGSTARPWDEEEFEDPADVSLLNGMNAGQLLKELWDGELSGEPDGYEDEDPEYAAQYAPFTRQFPGLAPAMTTPMDPAQLQWVLDALPPARIGLVPAARPADALPQLGWLGTDQFSDALPIAAVLRSWQERFGARLLQVGFAEIKLLVERPPTGYEAALRVAAEQWAFCDECGGEGLSQVSDIAARMSSTPVWTFWWD